MSDSLRDQLLQAGFTPKPAERPNKNRSEQKQHKGKQPRGKQHTGKPGAGKSPVNRQLTDKQNRPSDGAQNKSRHQRGNTLRAHDAQHPTQSSAQQLQDAEAAKRKAIKGQIKALIEAAAVKEYQGESVYRFILSKRIRELHVQEGIRQQLVAGTLVITRLNGSTWLVPQETATAIRELNPNWALVTPTADTIEDISGYEDFQVPDDLQW